MILLLITVSAFIVGCWLSPFPYWPAYFRLWKHVLFDTVNNIPFRVRVRQSCFLLKYLLLCPMRTLLWYLDELLFPGYKRRVVRPVFVTGLPRSGTTFLHRTLAADTDTFFAVRYFEWSYPYLTVQKLIRLFGIENRFKNMSYWPDTEDGRAATKMHRFSLNDWEEDSILFQEFFLYHILVTCPFPYPDLFPYVSDFSRLPSGARRHMLNVHQKVVKKMMYLKGTDKIYLSKQTNNDVISSFLHLYPDAPVISTLRPANDSLGSSFLLGELMTQFDTGIEDPTSIPGWEQGYLNYTRGECLRLMHLLQHEIAPEKQHCVPFGKLTRNTASAVSEIYAQLGMKQSDTYVRYLDQLQQSQKTRERGYDYEQPQYAGFEEFDAFISKIAPD